MIFWQTDTSRYWIFILDIVPKSQVNSIILIYWYKADIHIEKLAMYLRNQKSPCYIQRLLFFGITLFELKHFRENSKRYFKYTVFFW